MAAFVKIWALALLSLSLSPLYALPLLCLVYLCSGSSPQSSLSLFPAHSTPPSPWRCCVVVVVAHRCPVRLSTRLLLVYT